VITDPARLADEEIDCFQFGPCQLIVGEGTQIAESLQKVAPCVGKPVECNKRRQHPTERLQAASVTPCLNEIAQAANNSALLVTSTMPPMLTGARPRVPFRVRATYALPERPSFAARKELLQHNLLI